jgi:hypothetical protein
LIFPPSWGYKCTSPCPAYRLRLTWGLTNFLPRLVQSNRNYRCVPPCLSNNIFLAALGFELMVYPLCTLSVESLNLLTFYILSTSLSPGVPPSHTPPGFFRYWGLSSGPTPAFFSWWVFSR